MTEPKQSLSTTSTLALYEFMQNGLTADNVRMVTASVLVNPMRSASAGPTSSSLPPTDPGSTAIIANWPLARAMRTPSTTSTTPTSRASSSRASSSAPMAFTFDTTATAAQHHVHPTGLFTSTDAALDCATSATTAAMQSPKITPVKSTDISSTRGPAKRTAASRCTTSTTTTTSMQPRGLGPLLAAKRYKSVTPTMAAHSPTNDAQPILSLGVAQRQSAKRASSKLSQLQRPVARRTMPSTTTTVVESKANAPPTAANNRVAGKRARHLSGKQPRQRRGLASPSSARLLATPEFQEETTRDWEPLPVPLSPGGVLALAAAELTMDVDWQSNDPPLIGPHPCFTAYYADYNIRPVPLSTLALAPRPVLHLPSFGFEPLPPAASKAVFLADHEDDALRESLSPVVVDPTAVSFDLPHLRNVDQAAWYANPDNVDNVDNVDNSARLDDDTEEAGGWGVEPLHRLLARSQA